MKRLLAWIGCLVLLVCTIAAKVKEPKLVIEVNTAVGNDIAFIKDHVYLRVFDNGRLEYWDKRDEKSDFIRHESQLSPSQLKSVTDFLDGSEVKELSGMYPAYPPQINFGVMIGMAINRGEKTQEVGTHFYKLPLGGVRGNKSPQALVNLICHVENLREDARHWVAPEGYCSK